MANSYTPQDFRLKSPTLLLGASAVTVISQPIGLTAQGSLNLRVDLKVSGVTVGSGITAKLQHRSITGWTDLAGANATIAITADGEYSMTQLVVRAADQANMPLKKSVRVVITTTASSVLTVNEVRVQQGM